MLFLAPFNVDKVDFLFMAMKSFTTLKNGNLSDNVFKLILTGVVRKFKWIQTRQVLPATPKGIHNKMSRS